MRRAAFLLLAAVSLPVCTGAAFQAPDSSKSLDERVTTFLERNRFTWRDMNVPEADGRMLYDIVIKKGYKRALEIGTSTGHSGIWTAWALAKTGGRLITIDIDEGRYREALANFKQAGLDGYIDARLADAHDLVPRLEGPFDFVFIDADKEWYTNYAKAVISKVRVGGCIAAHNASPARGWRGRGQGADYYSYVTGLPFLETTVVNGQLAISYKRADK
jgi:caffeoyl-CoA O-methyltransferase